MRVFPFKSLDGVDLAHADLVAPGALRRDRTFALLDRNGNLMNGKRNARVHALRVRFDPSLTTARFESAALPHPKTFDLDGSPAELETWISRHFDEPVTIVRDDAGGFPDDTNAPGPTLISSATLETVASWFDELDVASVRARLRTNIEIAGVPPFWEDRLFEAAGEGIGFTIGEIEFTGINPCQRCVVPSRDPVTGAPLAEFAKTVARERATHLPDWAPRARFDHFYRLAVNTRIASSQWAKSLRVGDRVRLPDTRA